jgi:hypothetical protein
MAWICLSGLIAGCDGAPSRNILGSYFPSWMVCALVGIVLALVARGVLKATGLLQELPAPLAVLLAFGCADLATEENAVVRAETQVEDARASAHTAAAALAFAMGTIGNAEHE